MTQKPILYSLTYSPPARTVWLTAKYIGLELEIRNVDLLKGEQLSESYVKMNPQHTIPTLDDGGEYLWESAAICTYLIDKYGPTDGCALYPHDRLRRARIDQRLYFNAGILFPLLRASSIAVFLNGHAALERSLLDAVKGAMGHLVQFLEGGRFLVGDELTLADLAVAATLTNLLEWAEPLEAEQQQRLEAWLKRVADALPYFGELNTKHVAAYGEIFRQRLAQNGQK